MLPEICSEVGIGRPIDVKRGGPSLLTLPYVNRMGLLGD